MCSCDLAVLSCAVIKDWEHTFMHSPDLRRTDHLDSPAPLGSGDYVPQMNPEVRFPSPSADQTVFDALISDLSAQVTEMKTGQAGHLTAAALEQIALFLGADSAWVLEVQAEDGRAEPVCAWNAEGMDRLSGDFKLGEVLPWHYERFRKHKPVILNTPGDIPAGGEADRKCFDSWGVKSSVCVPICVRPGLLHVVAVQAVRQECDWSVYSRTNLFDKKRCNSG